MLQHGHESITSIDSMTHTELAHLDLTTHSCSYKYPTMYAYHMSVGVVPYVRKLLDPGVRT